MADERDSNGTKAWFWVLGGLVAVLAIALVVVLVTRDDGSDNAANTVTTTVAPAPTTSTAPPTTTAVPVTTTTVPLPVITDNPQSYAEYLYAAWQNNNQTAAANVASAEAVTQMFAQPYAQNAPYTFQGCGPAAGSLYCTWKAANGTSVQMTVRTLTGGLPVQVVMVQILNA